MTETLDRSAQTDAPILEVLTKRWSTRVFDPTAPIDEAALTSALEAARWAPSASNTQPWRAVVARRGTPTHQAVVDSLVGFNAGWAPAASALVVFLTERETAEGTPLRWSIYDTGQAAAYFTIQAHADGLYTHQMAGFDGSAIVAALGIDERFQPLTVMAVGDLGDHTELDDQMRERETAPRTRRPVGDSILVND